MAVKVNAQSTSWFLCGTTNVMHIQFTTQLPDQSMIIAGLLPEVNDSSFYQYSYLVIARISATGNILWARKSTATGYAVNGMNAFNNDVFISYDVSNYDSLTTKSALMKLNLNGDVIKNITMDGASYYGQYGQNKFLMLPNNNLVFMRSVFYQMQIQCFDTDLNLVWSRDEEDSTAGKNPAMNMCLDNSGNLFICGKRENSLEILSITPAGELLFGKIYNDTTMLSYLRAYNVFPLTDGYLIQGMLGLYAGSSFMIKTNLQGDILWMKNLVDGENSTYNFCINNGAVLQNGHFIFAGSTYTGRSMMGEMDVDGTIIWSKILEGASGYYYSVVPPVSVVGDRIVTAYLKDIYPYGSGLALLSATIADFSADNVCDYVSNNIVTEEINFAYTITNVPAASLVEFPVTYALEAALFTDCTSELNIVEICSNVGVNTLASDASVSIFPVPASDVVTVHLTNFQTTESVKIYNVLGELVWNENHFTAADYMIPVSVFPSGIYSAFIQQAGELSTHKFVVQH